MSIIETYNKNKAEQVENMKKNYENGWQDRDRLERSLIQKVTYPAGGGTYSPTKFDLGKVSTSEFTPDQYINKPHD